MTVSHNSADIVPVLTISADNMSRELRQGVQSTTSGKLALSCALHWCANSQT